MLLSTANGCFSSPRFPAALFLLGVHDVLQRRHSILRNYPVVGHLRFLLESFRPEIRQYLIEGDHDEVPFSRQDRGLVYQRAKGDEDKRPFGTIENVYGSGYAWLTHSASPVDDRRHRFPGARSAAPPASSPMTPASTTFRR